MVKAFFQHGSYMWKSWMGQQIKEASEKQPIQTIFKVRSALHQVRKKKER